ncbi:MAG: hypothetical protein MJA31_17445 [Clostridia bacterium]|nr:hypothetical protein [Clostridia bacterium]
MKKYIGYLLVLVMVFAFTGCGEKEVVKTKEELKAEIKAEMEAEEKLRAEIKAELEAEAAGKTNSDSQEKSTNGSDSYEDDEIVVTYAYGNCDDIDVSGLESVTFNARNLQEKVDDAGGVGGETEYQLAFFGEVNDVRISFSDYTFGGPGVEIGRYDRLSNTVLNIQGHEYLNGAGLFIIFKDGRGTENYYILGDELCESVGKVELISGYTALEKTPSSYEAYDLSELTKCIGMKTDEFESSDLMPYAEKMKANGLDNDYYEYTMKDLIKGYEVILRAPDYDYIIDECRISKNDEAYESLSSAEIYSFFGMDFEMSVIRARHQMDTQGAFLGTDVRGTDDLDDPIRVIVIR